VLLVSVIGAGVITVALIVEEITKMQGIITLGPDDRPGEIRKHAQVLIQHQFFILIAPVDRDICLPNHGGGFGSSIHFYSRTGSPGRWSFSECAVHKGQRSGRQAIPALTGSYPVISVAVGSRSHTV
jgi:hypothetical protein